MPATPALAASAIDLPALIQGGPLALHWYALGCFAGILQGRFYARAIITCGSPWVGSSALRVTDFDAFLPWAALAAVIGGRIGYVLLYDPGHYAAHPTEIVALWRGGMSFHGGLIGVGVAVVLFARSRYIPILALGDLTCAVYPIVHFFGWVANMINGVLPGRPTDAPWAMLFPGHGAIPRHPSQLYEAVLEGVALLLILALLLRVGALKRPGLLVGAFAIGYGLARIACEFFRDLQPGPSWGWLTTGILLSIPLLLAGTGFIWNALAHPPRDLHRRSV